MVAIISYYLIFRDKHLIMFYPRSLISRECSSGKLRISIFINAKVLSLESGKEYLIPKTLIMVIGRIFIDLIIGKTLIIQSLQMTGLLTCLETCRFFEQFFYQISLIHHPQKSFASFTRLIIFPLKQISASFIVLNTCKQ
jgi:hypothetical protein